MLDPHVVNRFSRAFLSSLLAGLFGAGALLLLLSGLSESQALAQNRPSQPQAGGPSGNTPGGGGTTSPGGGKPTTSPGGGGGGGKTKVRTAGGFVAR